jgi:Fe-S-cluster-containing dehydrogenase component/DMSO reductase anchor subunit
MNPGQPAIRSLTPVLQTVAAAAAETSSLVAALLREQQDLGTAVERFSRDHAEPAQARYYRDLIPLARPRPGEQYAFEVDLDVCTGCKACVAACHSLNGLDGPEVWRTVGLLHGGSPSAPTQQTVTTSCHHCVDPSCLAGCPVRAYEKDPVTGIVKHLDDQCIGCQYCTLMCPYDAPKYNGDLGIVRKCDMCSDRLSGGEAPACVQGCPNQAIRITVVTQARAIAASTAGTFLPGAPHPDHTVPTTVYKTARQPTSDLLPADFYSVSPEHSHPPLIILLVLTQLAAGAFGSTFLLRRLMPLPPSGGYLLAHAGFTLFLVLAALGASVFHLGRPRGAWRVFLGLGTSWMSREAITFGLFAKCGVLYATAVVAGHWGPLAGNRWLALAEPMLEAATALTGLFGVFCSAMIYVATRRPQWRLGITGLKFLGTTVVLGAACVLMVSQLAAPLLDPAGRAVVTGPIARALLQVILVAGALKLAFEALLLRHARGPQLTVLKRVAILMLRQLRAVSLARLLCGLGGLLLPALGLLGAPLAPIATLTFLALVAGEACERYLFFKAAPPSRMPGGLS